MKELIFCNVAEGTHLRCVTKQSKVDINQKYLLGKLDGAKNIDIANASDMPIGIMTDECVIGEDINISLLGADNTMHMIADESINAGDVVVCADSGKIRKLPSSAGVYYQVGIALSNGVSDKQVEVLSCVPQKIVVA